MKIQLFQKRKILNNIWEYIFIFSEKFTWHAGQYIIVKINHENADLRGKMRFITNSSAPFENTITITTKFFNHKSSTFKKALHNLKIGEEIEIKGPDGDIYIDNFKNNYIFIAGGIGITPFWSILKQLNFEKKMPKIILLYANKNKKILYEKELLEFEKKYDNLTIKNFISPNKINPIDIKKLDVNLNKSLFFISGPENMIYKIRKVLLNLGINEENIKEDYFTGYKKI